MLSRTLVTTNHVSRVYGEGLLLRLKAYREHRLDTWLALITRLVRFGVQLAFIGVAFSFVDTLGGWTVWHVVLMWSIGMAGRYFMEGLFIFANNAKSYLFDGGLDYLRVRPLPTFFCASATEVQLEETANALLFLVIGGIASRELGILGRPIVMLSLLLGVAGSTLVWLGIAFSISCAAVWLGRMNSVWQGLSAMYEHAKYPLDIMPPALRLFLTVLPLGFTAYYPVAFALRAEQQPLLGLVSPAVGCAVTGLSALLYHFALRRYQSTGT